MHIRLQDMLRSIADRNGITCDDGWPLLQAYLEWFLLSCGGMTLDVACALFWVNSDGRSLDDYVGLNSVSLTERIMTTMWGDFQGIHGIFNRMAFVQEHLCQIARDPRCHAFLADTYTSADYAARFAYERKLALPDELFRAPGRQARVIAKGWCHQMLIRLITTGQHVPRAGGGTAAARHIHALLGGRLDQETIRKTIAADYREHLGKRRKRQPTH